MKRQTVSSYPLANISIAEMQAAIPKLERGIEALKTFDTKIIQTGHDPQVVALSQNISRIITGIFGNNTHEYHQYHSFSELSYISFSLGDNRSGIIEIVRSKIEHAISTLESIKQGFLDEIGDAGRLGSGVKAIKAYESLSLHPTISMIPSY